MIVVADTGPINYLVQLSRIDLLHQEYGTLIIPQAVLEELQRPATPPAVRMFASRLPNWVSVHDVRARPNSEVQQRALDRLGAGEREAILLAQQLGTSLLLDERRARGVAAAMSVSFTGTLATLAKAARRGDLDMHTVLDELVSLGFYLDPMTRQRAIHLSTHA